MQILILLLTLTCGIHGVVGQWKDLDIRHVIKIMKDVPQVGFEPKNRGGGGGDIPLYLCLSQGGVNPYNQPGKLIYRPNGDLVCYVTNRTYVGGNEVAYRFKYQNQQKIWVFNYRQECYSWIPHTPIGKGPERWLSQGADPICRVYNPSSGFLIPGMMNPENTHCVYPYIENSYYVDGVAKASAVNVEVLIYNEYAYTASNYYNCW